MKNILLVAQREYFSEVKKKTFLIMTVLMPLLIIGFGVLIGFMASANDEQKTVAVIDESGLFTKVLKSGDAINYNFYDQKDAKGIKDTLAESESLHGLLIIPTRKGSVSYADIEKNTKLYTNGSMGIEFEETLNTVISEHLEDMKLKDKNINLKDIKDAKTDISISVFNIKEGKEDKGALVKLILSVSLTYIIFMFIMIYGVRVMRSVVEEKTNRVVEIIISSVKPFQLMMGKILGTTFVALTQFIIWILMVMGGFLVITIIASRYQTSPEDVQQAQEQFAKAQEQMPGFLSKMNEVSEIALSMNYPLIIFTFLVFFFFGYLFYSALFAAIGAAVDNDTDTQQFTWIAMVPMMLGVYGSYFAALKNPDGPVAFWLSMIPFTSPISMITRVPYNVPLWEILLSMVLLMVATYFMVIFAAKIYRVGILMHGKKASYKEIWKWLKYSS